MKPVRSLAVALSFLTRLPIATGAVSERDLAGALGWFPAVGAAMGLAAFCGGTLLAVRLGVSLAAVLVVAFLALASGALHLDGVADVFDGLGGARGDRGRMLAIMRDSHIGAHGATALALTLLLKVLALARALEIGASWSLVVFPAAARWAVIPLVVFFPPARSQGVAHSFAAHARFAHLVVGSAVFAPLLLWAGTRPLIPGVVALAASLMMGTWLYRKLGGLTGDVYGAAIETSEIAFLLAVGWQ